MEKIKNFLFRNLNTRQIIIKNAFWLYLSEGISKGLRLIVFLLIARILGPEKFGVFEYLYSFIGMFFLFADFGISTLLIRDYQQKEDKQRYLNNAFSLKLGLSSLFTLLALLSYPLAKKVDNFLVYFLIAIFYFLSHIEIFFESYFLAVQKTEKRIIFNLANSLIILLIISYGLSIYKSVLVVVLGYLLGMLIGLIIAYLVFLWEKKEKLSFDFSLAKHYLANGLALALFGTLGYVFFGTDKIILGYLRSIEEVAFYSVASRVIGALLILPNIFGAAFYPYLAQKAVSKESKDRIFKIFYKIIIFSIIVGFFSAVLLFFFAPVLIPLLFGVKFLASVEVLKIFIWILVFVFPTTLLDYLLISYNKQWLDFWITLFPAVINVILNFIFIPSLGINGAVLASIFSQFLNFVVSFIASVYVLKKL